MVRYSRCTNARIVIHSSVYDKTVLLNALALTTNAMILRRGRGLYNIWTQSFSPFFTNIWDIYYWSYYLLHFVPVLLGYKFTFSIPKSGLLLNSKTPLNIIDAFLDIILYSYTFSANLAVGNYNIYQVLVDFFWLWFFILHLVHLKLNSISRRKFCKEAVK